MTTTKLSRSALLLLGALLATPSFSDAPRTVMWADLVPRLAAADNPFAALDKDQLASLSTIASVRERKARGDAALTALEAADERALTRELSQAGVDVDGLLAKRAQLAKRVNPSLDGQLVRLPGYLLPLEFSGKRVTEFLLVPWVGACIHTPPPPPNQIVHVHPAHPVEMAGMFAPVWVTGQMSTTAVKTSVFILDGAADIDVGYSLEATEVVPYKE